MKKMVVRNKKFFLFGVLLISFIFFVGLIFATHVITTSSGGTSFSVNDSIINVFNITVNNTYPGGVLSNITSVNVTLPSGAVCTFVDASNGTTTGNASTVAADNFINNSNSLTWTVLDNTTTYVLNGSELNYFWFNASCSTPGDFNITVYTTNGTNVSQARYSSNLSLEVNDTTIPTASFGTNPINYYNSSSANVTFDVKCVDDYNISRGILYGNWTAGGWHANQTNSSNLVNNSFWNKTVTGIADGKYIWGIYCNDTTGNINWTTTNRTLTVDTTNPSASATCTPSSVYTGDTVTCTCGGSDSGSGINSSATSASSTPSTVSSGTFSYSCTVTDYAGNSATSTASYLVQGQNSGSSSSSSGGGTTSSFSYSKTIPQTAKDFSEIGKIETSGFSGGGLRARERVQIKINEQEHHVGIRELTTTAATIEIASDPVQVKLDVGEDAKIDVNDDNFYDIYVILNGINGGKADLTISYLHEEKPADSTSGSVSTTGEDVTPSNEGNVVEEEKSYSWAYWVVGIILILIVVSIILKKRK